jgi:hypothetical protein
MAVLVVVHCSIDFAELSVFPNVFELRYVKSRLTGNAASLAGANRPGASGE